MRFALYDHGGKAQYLRQRMVEAGHTPAESIDTADVLLVDCDWRWAHPRPELIREAHKTGAKVVVYPHGGQPATFIYDGLTEPDPLVDLRLEHGPGSIEAAELLGFDLKQKAPGWLYCPTRSFKKIKHPRRILFAPQHPNIEAMLKGTNGHDDGPRLNQHVYRQLLDTGHDIVVSLVADPYRNGVWQHPRATFVSNPQMSFPESFQLIQAADVVVAAGTLAAAAVACGKPTVMLGQGNFADYIDGAYTYPENQHLYADMFRYPLDASDGPLDDLIRQACAGTPETREWRRLFIGNDGSESAAKMVEELVGDVEPSTLNAIIGGVTAKSSLIGG